MITINNENRLTLPKLLALAFVVSLISACGGGGSGDTTDPTVNEQPIAYVKRPPTFDNNNNLIQGDLRDPTEFRPGAHLIVKRIASITASEIDVTAAIIGDTGDVRDPEFNYNGTKLVFSLRMEDDNVAPEETWDIYEYDLTMPLSQTPGSENPRRILNAFASVAGHDIGPTYLPGGANGEGRIVFSSTRAHRTGAVLSDEGGGAFSPTIEATDSNILALNLHVMDAADGGNLQQLTFHTSHDLDPTFIRNIPGLEWHIMFSRWDSRGVGQMSLFAMRPDGTSMVQLYGAHSNNLGTSGTAMHFSSPHETSNGDVLVIGRAYDNTQDSGDPIIINVNDYIDINTPTNANPGGTGPGQTSTTGGQATTEGSLSMVGRYNSVIPILDGTNRALASYSLCLVDVPDPNQGGALVTRTCSDPQVNLSDPATVIATPRYGVYVMDLGSNSVLPVTTAQPNTYYTDLAIAQGFSTAGTQLNYSFDIVNTPKVGTIHIMSVYDLDGNKDTDLNGVIDGVGPPSLADLINEALSTNDPVQFPGLIERPAYFLRVVKSGLLPDDNTRDIDNAAFGLDPTGQLMRQIVGYKQIEPDGSVRLNVPSDVPLQFSVVDRNGRRVGRLHNEWISVRPGEELTCHGCHDHNSGAAHGRQSATSPQINADAPALNQNGTPTLTMAYRRTELQGLEPSVDIVYSDFWTVSRTPDNSFSYSYNTLNTQAPLNRGACVNNWDENCRIIINYPGHIQPIWEFPRVDSGMVTRQCTSCHTTYDAVNMVIKVPDGKYQLDLTRNSPDANGNPIDTQDPDYFKSYIELLGPDNQLMVQGMTLIDEMFDTGQVDGMGNPILAPRSVFFGTGLVEIINSGQANQSTPFFEVFTQQYFTTFNGVAGRLPHWDPGANMGAGGAWLTTGELKLISEWIDIGAQYYNNPFVAPVN